MKMPIAITLTVLSEICPASAQAEQAVCTNASSVSLVEFGRKAAYPRTPFQFTGTISYARQAHDAEMRALAVSDSSGSAILTCANGIRHADRLEPGTTADFAGVIGRTAAITSVCIRAVNPPPTPIRTGIDDLLDGLYDCRLSTFTGMLRGVYESETAARWLILVAYGENNRIFISVPALKGTKERLRRLIGSRITATGVCVPRDTSRRRQTGRTFKVDSESSISECPSEASTKPPDVSDIRLTRPSRVFSLGRHSATGRVIAVWQGRNVLIRREDGDIVGLVLSGDRPPPPINENVLAMGLPESDLFRINLTDATWRAIPGEPMPLPSATPVSAHEISIEKHGFQLFMARYHGQAVSLRGIVRSLSRDAEHIIHLDCDGILVPVDASSLPECMEDVEIGCELGVSGTCVMTEENRNGNAALPQMNGFIVVLRQPGDLVITARPPWWTPGRMFAAIVALFATLLAILAWNVALRRAASRKGQALLKEQLGHVKAELKTEERTRLAVELHDSLAQNLTGVSLVIDTAAKLSGDDASAMRKHLATASSALKSCRDELRNCLWDLRNRALEAKTMDEAIRQTLAPHVIGRDVAIRFNVPRSRISDSTAHAILRIIRELTLNGIRHGAATRIQIAGCIDGNTLSFSVRDNGSGFDPRTAPGFAEGHYGLLGIRERIDELEGSFAIDSAPGRGTKATISLQMPLYAPVAQGRDGA